MTSAINNYTGYIICSLYATLIAFAGAEADWGWEADTLFNGDEVVNFAD